ncbi:dynein light chain Tctex-type 1-like protein [Sarcoptes scabiei]|uniref:Dynein light chain Tctex-type 1-like protein n=1 Tax=Sarcoptes scabiei TaxID=52283 RepID=A0A132ACC8_SARSC|nr:dynein light chain Tctex-type 1-like protein [Sarcoptes scabiei]
MEKSFEPSSLNHDEMNVIVKNIVESVIENQPYKHSDVGQWNDTIVEQLVSKLVQMDANNKYIVSCTIIQKNGAGVSTKSTCYWNNNEDRSFVIRWENKHILSIINEFL